MTKEFLLETFENNHLSNMLAWHSPPTNWKTENNQLHIATDGKTDFWQRTHYGFQADNGHFLFAEVNGDFVIETRVECDFKHQYDQAGLMIRVSDQCWIKTSVEYEPYEANKLGVVVTNHGYSDWSTQDVADDLTKYRLRIIRTGADYKVMFFSDVSQDWIQLRLFHLFDHPAVGAGLYCCSPKEAGFLAHYDYLKISER